MATVASTFSTHSAVIQRARTMPKDNVASAIIYILSFLKFNFLYSSIQKNAN